MANHTTFVNNGFMGSEIIADTVAHTKTAGSAGSDGAISWKGILVLTDTVFSILVGDMRNFAGLTGITIKAGILIPGKFSTITLASGIVQAFDDATY